MQLLKNKTAIITGASSGIGQQAALLFAQNGARLVIVARREQALQDLAEEIRAPGADVAVVAGDVRDKACQARAVAEAETRFGGSSAQRVVKVDATPKRGKIGTRYSSTWKSEK